MAPERSPLEHDSAAVRVRRWVLSIGSVLLVAGMVIEFVLPQNVGV